MSWDIRQDPHGRAEDVANFKRGMRTGSKQNREAAARALDRVKEEARDPRLSAARKELVKAVHEGNEERRQNVEHDIAKLQGQKDV